MGHAQGGFAPFDLACGTQPVVIVGLTTAAAGSSVGMSRTIRPRFGDADLGALRPTLLASMAVLFVPFAVIGYLLCLLLGVKGWMQVAVIVGSGVGASVTTISVGLGIASRASRLVERFVAPSGSTTPYEYAFSYEQALAAKGDVVGAIAAYEAYLRESPHNVEAHVQAAELHAKSGNTTRAIELFRAVRNVPGVSSVRDVYASQRLVDLYRGPARDEGRALVELRRLVERYPDTDTAVRAREALGALKSDRRRA